MWKSTETVILCSQPVLITLCCQSLFTGGQSRGAHGLSAKSQLAPPTEQQLEVFESEPEKCTSEFKSAFLNLIYHQSIKKIFIFYLFLNVLFRFPLCTNLQYPQNWGIKHHANLHVLKAWPSEPKWALFPLQTRYGISSPNVSLLPCDFTVC